MQLPPLGRAHTVGRPEPAGEMAGVGEPPHPSDGRDGHPVAGAIFVTNQKHMSAAADTVTRIDAGHMAPLSDRTR